MNVVAFGITLAEFGMVCFLIVFKECIRCNYINDKQILCLKISFIFIVVGLTLIGLGWPSLVIK